MGGEVFGSDGLIFAGKVGLLSYNLLLARFFGISIHTLIVRFFAQDVIVVVRLNHGSTKIIIIGGVENGVQVVLIIELTLVHLVPDTVHLVDQLIRSGNLLLNHHVSRLSLDLINFILINLEGNVINELAHLLLDVGHPVQFGDDSLVEHLCLVLLVQNFEPLLLDVIHHLFRLFDLFVELIEQILGWRQNFVEGLPIFDIHLKDIINVLDPANSVLDVSVLL